MYTIGYLVFGFDMTDGGDATFVKVLHDAIRAKPEEFGLEGYPDEIEAMLSWEHRHTLTDSLIEAGVLWTTYHGSAPTSVAAFGVRAGQVDATRSKD